MTLSLGEVSRFFFPLALSWLFMAAEAPIAMSIVSRLPNPEVSAAAFLIVMSVAIWIESPVIDLLSTSTTLARDRQSFAVITRFAQSMMLLVTVAHFLCTFTPLYDLLVVHALGVRPEVAQAAHVPLQILLFWSAFIGWRRTLQGILIRSGHTRLIGMGTALRVITMAATCFGLFWTSSLPSTEIVAIGLMASVAAESLFVHFLSRPEVNRLRNTLPGPGASPLRAADLVRFHFPLTATTMLMMFGTPAVTAALARTSEPVLTMAAFQQAIALLFLFRTVTFALPEVVITLATDAGRTAVLRRFSLTVGSLLSAGLLLFAVGPLDDLFFRYVQGTSTQVAQLGSLVLLVGCALPLVNAAQGLIRGLLTARRQTGARMAAVVVGMVVLTGALAAAVGMGLPGVAVGPTALTVAAVAELAVLQWFLNRSDPAPSGG
jgi:hypothetical protein